MLFFLFLYRAVHAIAFTRSKRLASQYFAAKKAQLDKVFSSLSLFLCARGSHVFLLPKKCD